MKKRLRPRAFFCLMSAVVAGMAMAGCGHHDAEKVSASGKPSTPAALDRMSLEELQRLDQNPTLSPLEKTVVESKIRQRQGGSGAPAPSASAGR